MGGNEWVVREVGKVSVAHENESEPRLVESVCVIVRRKRRIFFSPTLRFGQAEDINI